jgi:hypothetical protein
MALLKATQPQADLSLQALMFRIDQLEAAAGGETRPAPSVATAEPAEPPPAEAPATPSRPAAAGRQAPKGATAVAAQAAPEPARQPVGAVDLDQIVALWPAVADAIAEDREVLGHAIATAAPVALEGDRLTIAFPSGASFVKKKAEQGRDLVANAVRGMTGHSLALAFELSDSVAPPAGPATLDHDELIARLREEFAAEEVFDEPDEESS